MKNRKTVFLYVLSGIISCYGCLSVSAGSIIDTGKLKSGLLLNEKNNFQYNIYDYNTNDDNSVNVLDLCRAKKTVLGNHTIQSQTIKLSCSRPWITDDRSRITIPVSIKGNVLGVSALSFSASYDKRYFNLENAYSSAGNVFFSRFDDRISFSAPDGRNITNEGDFLYLVFSASEDVPYSTYMFSLSGVEGTMCELNGTQRELSAEECPSDSEVLLFTFSSLDRPETTVTTTVPVTTTPVTTTTVTTTTPVTTTTVTTTTPITTTTVTTPPITAPPAVQENRMSFSVNNAVLSEDGRKLRIPVYMDNNKTGLVSLNMIVKYDMNKFSLVGVSQGNYSGYGYVTGNKDNAFFYSNNNQNITESSGIVAYLEFDVNGGTDSRTYEFELRDIKAFYSENWNQKEIPKDKFADKSEKYTYSFGNEAAVTTSVTPEEVTTTTTVTEPPVIVTTTQEPVTTAPPVSETVPPASEVQPAIQAEKSGIELELLNMILDYRLSLGFPPLQGDDILFCCCDIRAEELTREYDFSRPDGGTRAELLKEYGSRGWTGSCELITKGTNDPAAVFAKIKKIFDSNPDKYVGNKDYRYVGVGCYKGYWSIIMSE